MNRIRVLLVEPNEEPREAEIENTDETFREMVGGELEYIKLESNVKLICNKNGKQQDLEFNRVIENDIVVGTFIVVGYKNGVITSLKDIDRQMRYFRLKNDKGMIEFYRRYIGNSSNIIEDKIDLRKIGYNRGFIVLDEKGEDNELNDAEEDKLTLEMKNECVTRLRLLKLYSYSREFYKDILNISYVDKNVLYEVNEYEQQVVNNLQLYKKIMIYHIIRLNNNVTYYLYVDRNKDNWVNEKRALLGGLVEAICIRPDSRIIGVETTNGIITKVV